MKNNWQKKLGIISIAAILLFFALTMILRSNIKSELNIVEGYPAQSKEAVLTVVDQNQGQLLFNPNYVQTQMRNRLLDFYGQVAPIMSAPESSNSNVVSEDAQERAVNAEEYVNFALILDQAFERGTQKSLVFELITLILFVLLIILVIMQKTKKILKKYRRKLN